MIKATLEIEKKITKDEVENMPKIGRGVDFDAKFSRFKALGICGSKPSVRKFLYEPPHDETAHFEYVLRDDSPMKFIQPELDFFRRCIVHYYGEEVADKISDEDLLTDKADILFTKLEARSLGKDWSNNDPVFSLLNLVTPDRDQLYLKLDVKKQNSRFPKGETEQKIDTPIYDPVNWLSTNDKIKLIVRKEPHGVPGCPKPIVLAIAHQKGLQVGDQEKRAQIQPIITPVQETKQYGDGNKDETFWVCSRDNGEYMPLHGIKGHFFFLAIYGAGENGLSLLPEGINPDIVSTNELAKMCDKLETVAKGRDNIVYGVLHYHVG